MAADKDMKDRMGMCLGSILHDCEQDMTMMFVIRDGVMYFEWRSKPELSSVANQISRKIVEAVSSQANVEMRQPENVLTVMA